MDTVKIQTLAAKLATSAKDGKVEIEGKHYTLVFSQMHWNYVVYTANNEHIVTFNTKSIKQAKQWLREYME